MVTDRIEGHRQPVLDKLGPHSLAGSPYLPSSGRCGPTSLHRPVNHPITKFPDLMPVPKPLAAIGGTVSFRTFSLFQC